VTDLQNDLLHEKIKIFKIFFEKDTGWSGRLLLTASLYFDYQFIKN